MKFNSDMEIYKSKQQSKRVDHHNHKLDQGTSGQGAGYTFSHIPRIPRATPPIPPPSQHRSRLGLDTAGTQLANSAPYGHITTTMDIHQTQRGQPSTVSSANSRSLRAANAATLLDLEPPNYYNQVDEPHNSLCSKCHGIILTPPPDEFPEVPLPPLKADGTWNFNYPLHHPALHRNNSIGGFTLTGQDTQKVKKSWMSKICSSHKIALVVSTFSFLVTIALTVTLILMKNKGMMEPM